MAWCGRWCWWITLGVVGALAFFLGAIGSDRTIPYDRHWGWVEPGNPKPGDKVKINWNATTNKACPGEITRWWEDNDGDIFDLPKSPARYLDRAQQSLSSVVVPPNATCGPNNKYFAKGTYACNWTHQFWPLAQTQFIRVNVSCDPPAAAAE